jgi:hypothetical protein
MIRKGILVFNHTDQEWRVWIGQTSYWIDMGYSFELRIQNRYFKAYLEKDINWSVRLDRDVLFVLHTHEVYKIRVNVHHFIQLNAPF